MASSIPIKRGFFLDLVMRMVMMMVRAERHLEKSVGSRERERCEWLMMGRRLTNGRTLSLGAKGHIPSGYIVGTLWVLKQFTHHKPSG